MITDINELFQKRIDWIETVPGGIHFHALIDGEPCQLKMNDFPDEPLYTVKWRECARDLDDLPTGWELSPEK